MPDHPLKVTVVLTHPIQYFSPWFRFIHERAPELKLNVLYAVTPNPRAQAVGFGTAFEWDRPLLEGYESAVLDAAGSDAELSADRFSAVDAPNLEAVLLADRPDFVLVPGWHAAVYRRAMAICRRHGVPVIYRGDSNLQSAPGGLRRAAWVWHTRRRLHAYSGFLSVGTRAREYFTRFKIAEPLVVDSPHAVDNEHFAHASSQSGADARRAFGLTPRSYTVLFVGKLEEKKHPLDAIRAVARLDGAELLVAGTGPLEVACRDEAACLGVRAVFAGFVNQSQLVTAYAAADCLILPSDGRETWGLVVNEAMAAGIPAVVTDTVGCQPDLVREGETGAVAPCGDVSALVLALERVRQAHQSGHDFRARCRETAERHGFAAATSGLVTLCRRLAASREAGALHATRPTQVLACCQHMVVAGGLERMTFDVLRALSEHGAGVHCLLNGAESSRIVRLAEHNGVPWSIARCNEPFTRRIGSFRIGIRLAWDVLRGNLDLLATSLRLRTTHILAPEFLVMTRHWPALMLLRIFAGVRVILRVGMVPARGRFYALLWRWVVSSAADRVIANSEFFLREAARAGVPRRKLDVVRNRLSFRPAAGSPTRDPWRVAYVGQIIPGKGLDRLIDAIGEIRRQGMPATLDIVADLEGWESPAYRGYRVLVRELAARDELAGAIRFLGRREDVLTVLAGAAVHCCPSLVSLGEGPANVVLEAKAAGTPSVITQSGALPEMIEHRVDGWITDTDEVLALAAGLEYFLGNVHRRVHAGQAAERSLARFSSEAFEHGWLGEFGLRDLNGHLCQATPTRE